MPPRELAQAKINLSLKVLGRRGDNYHALESLVVFAEAGDVLTATAASTLALEVRGPFAAALSGEDDNLVLRAARALGRNLPGVPAAHLVLEKNLPVASGIGGGSADAAAALRLLARLWEATLEENELAALALSLGADVPVCLDARPALMWGRGELISRIEGLPDFWLVLANPGVAVSTADVFRALAAPPLVDMVSIPSPPRLATLDVLVEWLGRHGNDLEKPARKLAPVIGDAIDAVAATQGCRLARMSGSGATCFGIYANDVEARAAAAALRKAHPDWWVAASAVGAGGQ
ncbi:MAG: 4-(cytidine 5'-diphospho)-2-C-methyl-D-erythritol kinase [Parvibaculum sp.]|uniref:4-(cytidine 5'-diphospho)-2-C-methyl-D-erythritol kinase n=1 Tax=Parvibaculum sp. TaxID=2024848 RepID=UPI0028422499|nr:4-(cytidine 5'-diphospho)-2-C-methyl-D-erythritol kinase [Parvibaculum sp.]MDR3497937.1 4-(cytidine 5'-diphospho)-2-C-methyl-D-erythritol kinase [Parvibaculum sp.]